MSTDHALFSVGQLIHHKLFGYRGVVIDVDPQFKGSDVWYKTATRTNPPREKPWYHVLVDGSEARTYVAERNLEPDTEGGPVDHPDVRLLFEGLGSDGYVPRKHKH